jgi:anti-anti-sigma factor
MQTESRVVLQKAEYDVYSVSDLDKELASLESGNVVVDFINVEYIDSTALGHLIRALKHVRTKDAAAIMTLENVRPRIKRVLEITGLTQIFTLK